MTEVKRAGSGNGKARTKEAVQEFWLFSAENFLREVSSGAMRKGKNIIGLVLDLGFKANELLRHVRRLDT